MGFFKRLTTLPAAVGVVSRFEAAIAADPERNSGEPYNLLVSAWMETIKPYETQEPGLFRFHLVTGISEAACVAFALLPIEHGSAMAARLVASFSYPAYADTPKAQNAWIFLTTTFRNAIRNPAPFNQRFQARNPITFEAMFAREPFIPERIDEALSQLLLWATIHRVGLP